METITVLRDQFHKLIFYAFEVQFAFYICTNIQKHKYNSISGKSHKVKIYLPGFLLCQLFCSEGIQCWQLMNSLESFLLSAYQTYAACR